jgi:hypothetical protein
MRHFDMLGKYLQINVKPEQHWRLKRLALLLNRSMIQTMETIIHEEEMRQIALAKQENDETKMNVLRMEFRGE